MTINGLVMSQVLEEKNKKTKNNQKTTLQGKGHQRTAAATEWEKIFANHI